MTSGAELLPEAEKLVGTDAFVAKVHTRLASCFNSREDYDYLRVRFKAAVATYASIAMWVGGWNLISPRAKLESLEANSGSNILNLPDDVRTFASFWCIGAVLMVMVDTWSANMGASAVWIPYWCTTNRAVFFVRVVIAVIAGFMFWVGMYQFLDRGFAPDHWHGVVFDVSYILLGLAILALTNTLYWMAYLYPAYDSYWDHHPTRDCARSSHVKFFLLQTLPASVAQNLVWIGGYNLMENYDPPGAGRGWWREVAYVAVGLFLLTASGAFVQASWIPEAYEEEEEEEEEEEATAETEEIETRNGHDADGTSGAASDTDELAMEEGGSGCWGETSTWMFRLKALAALLGQVIHNTGCWTIFDAYLFPGSLTCNILYLVVGGLLCWCCGTLCANFGCSPGEPDEEEEEGQGEAEEGTAGKGKTQEDVHHTSVEGDATDSQAHTFHVNGVGDAAPSEENSIMFAADRLVTFSPAEDGTSNGFDSQA